MYGNCGFARPKTVTHPNSNQNRRTAVTSLMRSTLLPLRHTTSANPGLQWLTTSTYCLDVDLTVTVAV